MTKAVCFKCGEIKRGSFTLCNSCQVRPEGEAELVRSLALSDHYLNPDQIDQTIRRIKNGETIEFSEDQMNILTADFKEFLLTPMGQMLWGGCPKPHQKKWWQFWKS